MTALERWAAAFAKMDQRRRGEMLAFAEDTAKAYPAVKPRQQPTLRVIKGGAK